MLRATNHVDRTVEDTRPMKAKNKVKHKRKPKVKSPLLVMAIESGWLGDSNYQCVFAAIRLLPSVVKTLRGISRVSHAIGGTELLLGNWPVLWDHEIELGIEKTVWRVSGNRHWADAYDAMGRLLGRTVYLDIRELKMMSGEVIWHETEDSDATLEGLLNRSFVDLAYEHLAAMGLVSASEEPPESQVSVRSMLLDLKD